MIYRTAHRSTYRNLNQNLGMLSYRIAQLQNQIASERRINTPSDDPTGAAKVLDIRSRLSSINQYGTNVAVSDDWLRQSGNALQSLTDTLNKIYVDTEQGATDTYSDTQRQILMDSVNGLFQNLIQFSNQDIGGSYLFGGQRVTTQPFASQVEAQKVIAGCQNSSKWTGKVTGYGDPTFSNRPDLPIHSQDFLIEVVQAGGVDSRYFSKSSPLHSGQIKGPGYGFTFEATDPKYNNSEIRFVTGPENRLTIGSGASGIKFGGTSAGVNVQYVYGDSTGTTASWSASSNTIIVSLQTEPAVIDETAIGTGTSGINFGGTLKPVNVQYVMGTSAGTTATWNSGTNTLVVSLETDGGTPPKSVASAGGVMDALSALETADPTGFGAAVVSSAFTYAAMSASNTTGIALPGSISFNNPGSSTPVSVASAGAVWDALQALETADPAGFGAVVGAGDITYTAPADPAGIVQPDKITYNNGTSVVVDGDRITVYLERDNLDPPASSGAIIATAEDIYDALAANASAAAMITVTLSSGSSAMVVTPTPVYTELEAGKPYTLAHTTVDPTGTQNALDWSIKNGSPFMGVPGNQFNVSYVVDKPLNNSAYVTFDTSGATSGNITVHLAVSAAVYEKIFIQVYNDPGSGAYKDAHKAAELATAAGIQTTANDVVNLVKNSAPLNEYVDVAPADGNSGEGKVNVTGPKDFKDGYDQPALFRVSQDGGKTWGPPMSYGASEYLTGDKFHNAYLGHASMTTGMAGKGNDLVFTAKQMGTWGNDLSVEYNLTHNKPSPLSVTVGPETWNICVNLEVDANGNILSTADDIMKAINNHPVANQMVTADLANYHEGGSGVVKPMECTKLSVGEPYEIDGKTIITPLGHATANVSFGYTAGAQKCPNIIFQSIKQGPEGNDIGIRYTTSADPTFFASASVANNSYQSETTARYETTPDGQKVLVVHLATEALPSCPDAEKYPEDYKSWIETYPVYSCTETRAIISTADSVVEAVINKNLEDPENAAVWPSLERWPSDGTAKVGVTDGTVRLTGGNKVDDAGNHGVNLKFIPDGTALQVGDIFEVPVGWYRGDEKNMDFNTGTDARNTMNMTGNKVLGANGQDGNILDTVQRLMWALEHNDTELIGKELPKMREAIEKITTLSTQVGTRQIRNQFMLNNLEQAQFSSESLLSGIEDADFSQLITDLKNAQTVYEACLGATGLTSKVSLLNYI
ncbi:MAG: hypothetical protein LBV79_09915 [Candidatus Adiutrix sp.]|jgi:flagellin-like hook-associated protein FlgL|nr:hypothetical protein [Candidatus Adiutrix sp.]